MGVRRAAAGEVGCELQAAEHGEGVRQVGGEEGEEGWWGCGDGGVVEVGWEGWVGVGHGCGVVGFGGCILCVCM
jgi:hypothetical protein